MDLSPSALTVAATDDFVGLDNKGETGSEFGADAVGREQGISDGKRGSGDDEPEAE